MGGKIKVDRWRLSKEQMQKKTEKKRVIINKLKLVDSTTPAEGEGDEEE